MSLSPSAQTSRLRHRISLDPNHKAPPLHRDKRHKEDAHGQHGSHDGKNDEHGGDGNADAELGLHGHAAMLHERLKMVLVKLRGAEPSVEALRTIGEARSRKQQEWRRGQDGKNDTDASKGSKEKAKHDKEMSHEGNLRQALALGATVSRLISTVSACIEASRSK